jgi:hypothetical protein
VDFHHLLLAGLPAHADLFSASSKCALPTATHSGRVQHWL